LSEQHRIIAKVDELIALCDRLEDTQREQVSRRQRLTAAIHHHLNSEIDAETIRSHAKFFIGHLPHLAANPNQIKQLRSTIRNLAVCGKLEEGSKPASVTTTLGEVATLQNGYAFKSEWFASRGVRLLRNANVSHGVVRWDELVQLPEKQADDYERFQLRLDDIVLSLDPPFIVTGTKVARIRAVDLPCLLLQRVGRFEIKRDRLNPDYLFLWLLSPQFTGQIDPGRSNGVPHISSKQVEAAQIVVPPLPEQLRIVAKVDKLMTLCDRLEKELVMTETEASRLLESVLYHTLNDQGASEDAKRMLHA
jgi:type I restriction enzyme S subunit